jgi:hypothetical protein
MVTPMIDSDGKLHDHGRMFTLVDLEGNRIEPSTVPLGEYVGWQVHDFIDVHAVMAQLQADPYDGQNRVLLDHKPTPFELAYDEQGTWYGIPGHLKGTMLLGVIARTVGLDMVAEQWCDGQAGPRQLLREMARAAKHTYCRALKDHYSPGDVFYEQCAHDIPGAFPWTTLSMPHG